MCVCVCVCACLWMPSARSASTRSGTPLASRNLTPAKGGGVC